jgi:V/A-type H+-transporting ATPase subunit B
MGFKLSKWDETLLAYGDDFEKELMALEVNIPIEEALDLCWDILARHFDAVQTGLKDNLVKEYWPKKASNEAA